MTPAMPTTETSSQTAPELIRDWFDGEVQIYVTPRHPYNGLRYETFGLVVLAPAEESSAAVGRLHQRLLENGLDVPLTIHSKKEGPGPAFDFSEALEI